MATIRIFVSSPGDVSMERICAEKVIDRLQLEHSGRVKLEKFFWEHEPMRATASFNDPDNIPSTAEFDVVICILWSRLGTMLSRKYCRSNGEPYPSGTAFELETAAEAYAKKHSPDLLVYRKTQDVPMPIDNPELKKRKQQQLDALEQFISEFFYHEDGSYKGAITRYEVVSQFEARLEKPLRSLIERRLAQEREQAGGSDEVVSYTGNPYLGFARFGFQDARIFFGRSQAIEDVLTVMRRQAQAGKALTLVHGVSGSGKSSLIRAGVIPMLASECCVVEGVPCWVRATMTIGETGDGLFLALARSLFSDEALPGLKSSGMDAEEFARLLEENPARALPAVYLALEMAGREVQVKEELPQLPRTQLVLLVDQLEQIFSDDQRFPKTLRQAFAAVLTSFAKSDRIWVVATIRSDQIGRLVSDLPDFAEVAQGGHCQLLSPSQQDMDLMIRMPAKAAGVIFEENPATKERLETRLLREASETKDGLPLLSFVLSELFQKRERRGRLVYMTHDQLDKLGGIEGAVTTRAQEIYTKFAKEHPEVAEGALVRLARALATLDANQSTAPLRRSAPTSFLDRVPGLSTLVDELAKGRLLTKGPGLHGETVVTVTHEALLRKWTQLHEAIEKNRDFLLLRAAAATAANEWLRRGRDAGLTWNRGVRLKDARVLHASLDDLDLNERAFVEASLASAGKRRVMTVVGATVVVLVLGGGAWGAVTYRTRMDHIVEEDRARKNQIAELEQQLTPALEALRKKMWPEPMMVSKDQEHQDDDSDTGENGEEPMIQESDPARDVWEISRRLLKLDEKHKDAFAAFVQASISLGGEGETEAERVASLKKLFSQWTGFGLPKSEILNLEAQMRWEAGDKATAVNLWNNYLKSSDVPKALQSLLYERVTSHYLDVKLWREAESVLNTWLGIEENALAYARRAKARMSELRLDEAAADMARAEELNPTLEELVAIRPEWERLLKHTASLQKATAELGKPLAKFSSRPRINRARILLVMGRYSDAIEDLDEAAKMIKGKSQAVELLRAICLTRDGKSLPKESTVYVPDEVKEEPAKLEEWLDANWKNITEVLSADTKLINGAQGDADVLMSRCTALYRLYQHPASLEDAEAAIKLEPGNSYAWRMKGQALASLGRYDDTLKCAEELTKQGYKGWEIGYVRAMGYSGLEKFEEALKAITDALKFKEFAAFHSMRARYLRELNRYDEAEKEDAAAFRLKQEGK